MEMFCPVRSGTLVISEPTIDGFALISLSNLYSCQPLFKTIHLFFHDPHFYVQGFVKLHEPIDVSRKPINTILHARESLVHFLPEIAKVKIDDIESPINLHKSSINLLKSPVNLRESTINLLNSPIIPRKPTINLFNSPVILRESTINLLDSPIIPRKPAVDLLESCIRPPKSSPNKPFNSCKALIDGSSFLCRSFLSHLPYLAALSPDESQVLKSLDDLVRPDSDFRSWISDSGLLRISDYNLHFAFCNLPFTIPTGQPHR